MEYVVLDADGNNATDTSYLNLDEALRAAFEVVRKTWDDWEPATIAGRVQHEDPAVDAYLAKYENVVPIAKVERGGQKGSRLVRVSFAGAGWLSTTFEVIS